MNGLIDAWNIRLIYNQFIQNGLTIYSVSSKVENIGFDNDDANHTNVYNRHKTILDDRNTKIFVLTTELELLHSFVK